MITSIGGINILESIEIKILRDFLESWKNQEITSKLYLGLYVVNKYKLQVDNILKEFNNILILRSKEELSIIKHFNNIYQKYKNDFSDNCWFIYTDLGIWHPNRTSVFNQCINNIHKFNSKIDYIRISRSIFTNKKISDFNVDKINKLLEDGDIINNQDELWGELTEYCISNNLIKYFFDKINHIDNKDKFSLWNRTNADRYFLKYLNCNKFKLVNLDTDKLSIFYWMYFNIFNTPNMYFRNTKKIDLYENEFCILSNNNLLPSKHKLFQKGISITTPFGPGEIIDILPNSIKKYKVKVKWEDKTEEHFFKLREIYHSDTNYIRKNLYLFITNLINNIEIYLCNFVFTPDGLPTYEHFNKTIQNYLKEFKERRNTDDMLEKLGHILDDRDMKIKEDIYSNNLSKNIFNFIIDQNIYQKITYIENL